jgi:membrane protein implicated in regulation of membrane protease activity
MNPKTPRTLVQFSAILVVLGIAVTDPLAGLLLMVLAGILSIISIIFGTMKVRVIAIILLAIVISFAIWKFPEARQHLQRYRDRAPAIEKGATSSNIEKGGSYDVTYMEIDEGKGSRG